MDLLFVYMILVSILFLTAISIMTYAPRTVCAYKPHMKTMYPSVHATSVKHVELDRPPAVMDGVLCTLGHRILARHQKNTYENGIYVVVEQQQWRRAVDMMYNEQVHMGSFVYVLEGHEYAGTMWAVHLPTESPHIDTFPNVEFVPALDYVISTKQRSQGQELHSYADGRLAWSSPILTRSDAIETCKSRKAGPFVVPMPSRHGEYWVRAEVATSWTAVRLLYTEEELIPFMATSMTSGPDPPGLTWTSSSLTVSRSNSKSCDPITIAWRPGTATDICIN